MTPKEFTNLRDEIRNTMLRLVSLKARLDREEKLCSHVWGTIEYDPIEHKGYHFSGDPVGTMGIDRQLPMDVPSSIEKRWTRTCIICGKIEETKTTRKQKCAGPIKGTAGEVDVPYFRY